MLGDRVPGHKAEAEVLAHYHHLVGVARTRENTMILSVNVDDSLGIRLAIDHLLGLGHRQIGFVGNSVGTWIGAWRYF